MFVDGNGNSLSTSNFIVIDPWLNDVFEFDIFVGKILLLKTLRVIFLNYKIFLKVSKTNFFNIFYLYSSKL